MFFMYCHILMNPAYEKGAGEDRAEKRSAVHPAVVDCGVNLFVGGVLFHLLVPCEFLHKV